MATFVVIPLTQSDAIGSRISNTPKVQAYFVPPGVWLASFNGTSEQLSDLLGISEGDTGTGLVLNFNSYFGRANPQIWEWIQSQQSSA